MTTIATVQFSVVARTPYLGQLGQADINQEDINEKEEEDDNDDKEEKQEEQEDKQNTVDNHSQINLNVLTWKVPKNPSCE